MEMTNTNEKDATLITMHHGASEYKKQHIAYKEV